MSVKRIPPLITLLALFVTGCTASTDGAKPASTKPNMSTPKSAAAEDTPRQCTTRLTKCFYGTGPAGVPCSCWSSDGAPDHGITTK